MTKKQQILYGVLSGTVFLITLIILAVIIECPTSFQNGLFKTVLALGAGAYATIIPGFINVEYRGMITAGGALGVFAIVFFFSPANLADFKGCNDNTSVTVTGIVFLSNKPTSDVEVIALSIDKVDETNSFGKFDFEVDLSTIDKGLSMYLTHEEGGIDTVVMVSKEDLTKTIEIYLTAQKKEDAEPVRVPRLEGNLYYDGKPLERAELRLLQLSKSSYTNSYGKFDFSEELSSLHEPIRVQVVSEDHEIDTIFDFEKSDLMASLNINFKGKKDKPVILIPPKVYCIECKQFDLKSKQPINPRRKCSSDKTYLENYISGYTRAAREQGRKTSCKWM